MGLEQVMNRYMNIYLVMAVRVIVIICACWNIANYQIPVLTVVGIIAIFYSTAMLILDDLKRSEPIE